jgi:hypothetical protein
MDRITFRFSRILPTAVDPMANFVIRLQPREQNPASNDPLE